MRKCRDFLLQAEQEALTAQQLDNTNTLALAYYAEILVDQQQWDRAERSSIRPWSVRMPIRLMDVHRVNA